MTKAACQLPCQFFYQPAWRNQGCGHGNFLTIPGRLVHCILEKTMNCNNVNSTLRDSQVEIVIETPYGKLHIGDISDAYDHATMKARELKAFFVLISGDGQENFSNLRDSSQNSLLWMAEQSASQLESLLLQVQFEL